MIEPIIKPGREIYLEIPKGSNLNSSVTSLKQTGQLNFSPQQLQTIQKEKGIEGLYNVFDYVQLLKAVLKIK
ncbi:MAG: hypothetical protein NUV87_02195 [Candidatus Roizmanbacteria bacterium]|nr:hypothetical protein [Candidatus Roizmanbacteria bacterium]MCR4313434.1 hypothetical protein [Candidatus Roizmanbacteria bacterium]